MTVAGTIVHLAKVEEMWTAPCRSGVGSRGDRRPRRSARRAEWQEAPKLAPDERYGLWYGTISRCRLEWTGLIAGGGLGVHCTDDPGYVVNRRRRLVHIRG